MDYKDVFVTEIQMTNGIIPRCHSYIHMVNNRELNHTKLNNTSNMESIVQEYLYRWTMTWILKRNEEKK